MPYEFTGGDSGSVLRVTFKDNATKQPADLTGGTAQLHFRPKAGDPLITKTMTILDQITLKGRAEYLFQASELIDGATLVWDADFTDSLGRRVSSLTAHAESVRARLT